MNRYGALHIEPPDRLRLPMKRVRVIGQKVVPLGKQDTTGLQAGDEVEWKFQTAIRTIGYANPWKASRHLSALGKQSKPLFLFRRQEDPPAVVGRFQI